MKKEKPITLRYDSKFHPQTISKFLRGQIVSKAIGCLAIRLPSRKNILIDYIDIELAPSFKRVICKIVSKIPSRFKDCENVMLLFNLEEIKKVWYESWHGEKVVVFEKKTGAQLAIRTSEENGYNVEYHDSKWWGLVVG